MTPKERQSLLIAYGIIGKLLRNDPENTGGVPDKDSFSKVHRIQQVCASYEHVSMALLTIPDNWTLPVCRARLMALLLCRVLLPCVTFSNLLRDFRYGSLRAIIGAHSKAKQQLLLDTLFQSDYRLLLDECKEKLKQYD